MKTFILSVHEFAQPSPRTGSLEPQSGLRQASEIGIELHQVVQAQRKKDFEDYRSEVRIQHEFEREGYVFKIDGRMDGLFEGETPVIEEIKSSFNIYDLLNTLKAKGSDHPYALQVLSYGYFYFQEHSVIPELNLHLISSRNRDTLDFAVKLRPKVYEEWLDRRLTELVAEAKLSEKRRERRLALSAKLSFPFPEPRSGQRELIGSVEQAFREKKHLMLQAPTGLGKTMGVLYPSLKESLARGQRVIYVTPKNSQQSVAEEAIERFQEQGSEVKSLTLTAKSKLCMKAEPLCNPEYCEYARDYYDKLIRHDLKKILAKKKKLSSRVMKNLAEKYQVCPFELQLENLEDFDAVICDYNYVFANRSALARVPTLREKDCGKPNLVIDEAHNLPSRTMGYYSPSLSSFMLEKMREDFAKLPKKFAADGELLLDECLQVIQRLKPDSNRSERIQLSPEVFEEQDENLKAFLSRYLDSDVEIKPRDVVLRMVFYWSEFTDILKQVGELPGKEFFMSFVTDNSGGSIKITCCDASELIRPRYENYENVVAFSATLKPFEYYSKLSGLESPKLETLEFESPFARDHRKIMVIPQISTKYSDRSRNYSRIAEVIEKISGMKKGNYLVFFPSFDFLEQTAKFLRITDKTVIRQNRYMKNDDVEGILKEMKERKHDVILMAVQGGVFSEGVDYPGDMVIGAFVVGPPLPTFDFERENIKDFYQERYQEGFDYAYTYPAMAKAIQSAGRVIRSPQDKGVIVLMDDRFLDARYVKTMPRDWFDESASELVSQKILKDVQDFWRTHD